MIFKIKRDIRNIINSLAYKTDHFSDMKIIDNEFGEIYERCKKYTVTSKISLYALYKAIEYIVKAKISGDIVECGTWKGGSAMVVAFTLIKIKETHRNIYLYDTFGGMTKPTEEDLSIPNGTPAINKWNKNKFEDWGVISLEEAKKNILSTGYPEENLVFARGDIEETIPKILPATISILRLDTDWYKSTKHELIHLYPLLEKFGVFIVDDYGYWAGSKKAVDEYFSDKAILLNRIDQTGRIGLKVFD